MASLAVLTRHLISRFPALKSPERVLGHEQIAGFRGKADPGLCFNWPRFYAEVYPGQVAPERRAVLDAETLAIFARAEGGLRSERPANDWPALSAKLERFVGGRCKPLS